MTKETGILIAIVVVGAAFLWKRVGDAKNAALKQAAASTAKADKLADAINKASNTAAPLTGALADAMSYTKDIIGAIAGSNQQRPSTGPGGGQFI